MPANRRRIAATAPYDRWVLLGKLLEERRRLLGYTYRRPAFERDTDINSRLSADLETAAKKRVNHFTEGSLRLAAHGYQVTYESMLAILAGKADALAPAGPAAAPAAIIPSGPPGWMAADEKRSAANEPYADEIKRRLAELRARGIRNPSGAQLFGEGTPDAGDWDAHADWGIRDRVWFIADLQRLAAGRAGGNSGEGTGA
jgi:hypothetical protein